MLKKNQILSYLGNKGNNKITELRTILQGKVKAHNYINRQNQSKYIFMELQTLKFFPLKLCILTVNMLMLINRNESGRFGALKSDSTHHFFRNAI
jgi:hypothetical protein